MKGFLDGHASVSAMTWVRPPIIESVLYGLFSPGQHIIARNIQNLLRGGEDRV